MIEWLTLVAAVTAAAAPIVLRALDRRGQCTDCQHPRTSHTLHFARNTPTCRWPGCGCEAEP